MERFLTLFITSLCAAPLFFFAFTGIFFSVNKVSGERSMGVAYFGVWCGFLLSFGGFFLVWWLAQRFFTGPHLRSLQICDGLALAIWLIVYLVSTRNQTYLLAYPDHRAVLDVEVRIPKPLLQGKAIDSLVVFQYIGQNFELMEPMPAREEGDVVIKPWGTTVIEVNQWTLRVFVQNQPVRFLLDLPRRPRASTGWSGWQTPKPEQQTEPLPQRLQQNVAIRYRFRLVPHGSS